MEKKKNRDSRFELLRIFAMLMIISYHIVLHCVNIQLTDPAYVEKFQTGFFNHPNFYKQLLVIATIMSFGSIANALFILISGYFLVAQEKIHIGKTASKLVQQLFFAVAELTVLSTFFYKVIYYGDPKIAMINFSQVNNMSWFLGYYFFIIIFATIWLNKFLHRLSKKKYQIFLVVLFAAFQFSWFGIIADDYTPGLKTLLLGMFLFSLGGYIHRYEPLKKYKASLFVVLILLMNCIIWVSYYNNAVNNLQINKGKDVFTQSILEWSNYSPIAILIAVCMFELFSRIHISSNRIINYIGGSTLMIYLLHDNGLCYSIWDIEDWVTPLWNSPITGFTVKLITWACIVFLYGFISYIIFNVFIKFLKHASKLFLKKDFDQKLQNNITSALK